LVKNNDISSKEKLIASYSDDSVGHLEPLKHIFKKPSMYLGDISNPQHTLEEALMNSIDEAEIGVAENIIITFHSDGSYSVQDDGRGLPQEYSKKFKMPAMRAMFLLPNTGKAFADNNNSLGTSQHGIGMKAVVATSEWLELTSYRLDKVVRDRYELVGDEPGVPKISLTKTGNLPSQKRTPKEPEHGTLVRWKPSLKVFDSDKINKKNIEELAHNLVYLNPGLKIKVVDEIRGTSKEFREVGGISSLVEVLAKKNESKLITPIYTFKGIYISEQKRGGDVETTEIKADVSFAWSDSTSKDELLFTNNVPNPQGGTPIIGANRALAKLINKYSKDLGLSKDQLESRDILPGVVMVLSVKHPHPNFDGQAKKEITSSDASLALDSIVFNDSQLVLERQIDGVREIVKLAIKRANDRKRSQEENFTLDKKASKLGIKKLSDCRKKGYGKGSELMIVEGDSAGGSIKALRDTDFQAMIAIRGKIRNVLKTTTSKVMDNAEVAAIFRSLNTGINARFDIKKLNYDRIIIATDQDPDGSHISCLILTLLLRFTPDLIREGHVYRVLTPLFINHLKNGKIRYCYSNDEQNDFLNKNGKSVVLVQRNKGLGELQEDEVEKLILDVDERRLVQFQMDDVNEEDCYDIVEKMMGRETEERQALFFDPNLYQ